jgi:hypothetical protein
MRTCTSSQRSRCPSTVQPVLGKNFTHQSEAFWSRSLPCDVGNGNSCYGLRRENDGRERFSYHDSVVIKVTVVVFVKKKLSFCKIPSSTHAFYRVFSCLYTLFVGLLMANVHRTVIPSKCTFYKLLSVCTWFIRAHGDCLKVDRRK